MSVLTIIRRATTLALFLSASTLYAQFGEQSHSGGDPFGSGGQAFGNQPGEDGEAAGSPVAPTFGEPVTERWKIGMKVTAAGGPCKGLFATIPVPSDWPEQQVRIADEQVSKNVADVRYNVLEGGAKQMLVRIPNLASGDTAEVLITFEVARRPTIAPADPSQLVLPTHLSREVRLCLGPSPFIETRNAKVIAKAKELNDESLPAWEQVEKIYDWVRDNVEYRDGDLKGAVYALENGNGDCEEMTSLFIALCRVNKIPARMVWIPGHCYPEFYLEDQEGNGYWFPCQAAGDRAFGAMPETRPILQKGDNFSVPGKSEKQRYVAETLKGTAVRGGGKPKVQFLRNKES